MRSQALFDKDIDRIVERRHLLDFRHARAFLEMDQPRAGYILGKLESTTIAQLAIVPALDKQGRAVQPRQDLPVIPFQQMPIMRSYCKYR